MENFLIKPKKNNYQKKGKIRSLIYKYILNIENKKSYMTNSLLILIKKIKNI